MSDNKPFWIPSLNPLWSPKGTLMGLLHIVDPETGAWTPAGSLNEEYRNVNSLIHKNKINNFLKQINPCLTAFLLAGYQVLSIEICGATIQPQEDLRDKWIKLDLKNKRATLVRKLPEHESNSSSIKMRMEALPSAIPYIIGHDPSNITNSFFEAKKDKFKIFIQDENESEEEREKVEAGYTKSISTYFQEYGRWETFDYSALFDNDEDEPILTPGQNELFNYLQRFVYEHQGVFYVLRQ